MGSQDIRVVEDAPPKARPRRELLRGRERDQLRAAAAIGAFGMFVVVDRLYIANPIFLVPLIAGVIAYFVTRRGLTVADTALHVAGPMAAWISLWTIVHLLQGAPLGWQATAWVAWTVPLPCAALVGALLGRRRALHSISGAP